MRPRVTEKTPHQIRVEQFMIGARQPFPSFPSVPSWNIRLLRAKLILEEALETIDAMGFKVFTHASDSQPVTSLDMRTANFETINEPTTLDDIVKVVDGCADLSVVTTGTLSAFGVCDAAILFEVDQNNLNKLAEGTLRDDGKLIKPPGFKGPELLPILEGQYALGKQS